jgi:hypothetical protein
VGISPAGELTIIWHLSRAMGRLRFSTYAVDMKECNAPESNSTTTEKCTNDHIQSFLGFLNCDMIDLSTNIVLPSSNRNRICPRGRCRGGCSCRRRAAAWVGALVGKVVFLPTSEALPFPLVTSLPGLIGLIAYLYHQVATSFPEAHLQRTLGLSVLGPEQFQDE